MDLFNSIIDTTEQHLNILMDNVYLSTIIKVLLILYGCVIAPELPTYVLQLLDNLFAKVFVIVLIIFIAKRDLGIGLLIAICFILTLQLINKNKLFNLNDIKKIIMEGGNEINEELFVDTDDPKISNMENENHSREPITNFDNVNVEGHITNNMDSIMPFELSSNPPESCVKIPREMQTNMPPTNTMNQIINNTQYNNMEEITGFNDSTNFAIF